VVEMVAVDRLLELDEQREVVELVPASPLPPSLVVLASS